MKVTTLRKKRQRGVGMVEFTIAGIAALSLMICTVQMGIAMWNYHTLAYAVHETNRYISTHGRSCTTGGNNCTIYVGDVANKLKGYAVGLLDTKMAMTLTADSGATYTCATVSACESDTTQWPPVAHGDNYTGRKTTVTVSTTQSSMIVALWYGWSGRRINSVTLKASSTVYILF